MIQLRSIYTRQIIIKITIIFISFNLFILLILDFIQYFLLIFYLILLQAFPIIKIHDSDYFFLHFFNIIIFIYLLYYFFITAKFLISYFFVNR